VRPNQKNDGWHNAARARYFLKITNCILLNSWSNKIFNSTSSVSVVAFRSSMVASSIKTDVSSEIIIIVLTSYPLIGFAGIGLLR
jgi:hypothetical protein